jgi:hypothetical protein
MLLHNTILSAERYSQSTVSAFRQLG